MKDNQEIFNPNSNPPKVLSGADIVKVVRMAREKPQSNPKKFKIIEPIAWKHTVWHWGEVVKSYFAGIRIPFWWQKK